MRIKSVLGWVVVVTGSVGWAALAGCGTTVEAPSALEAHRMSQATKAYLATHTVQPATVQAASTTDGDVELVADRGSCSPDFGAATPLSDCGSDSDCAGFGKCNGGKCGGCGSDSDCNGYGKCSNSRCGACGSDSDCKVGRCSNGQCGSCGSDSDCHGNGRCSNGKCGSCGSDSDCAIGKCSNSVCGSCGSDSDCHGGRCSNSRCSNAP